MTLTVAQLHAILAEVTDPEIPALGIADLGVLRDVRVAGDEVTVTITPTYSGCPALEQIRADILATLHEAGVAAARVDLQLAPAWSTDWITAAGRRTLAEHGIAPPAPVRAGEPVLVALGHRPPAPRCPQCDSADTTELTPFGGTACRALWRCLACREPFDYVKPY